MPKGHSTLEPRIKALEELVAWHAKIISGIQDILTTGAVDNGNPTSTGSRIAALERRIAQMNDAFSRGNLPPPAGHQSTALQ
jgi:uncharacterized coiled-coil protein SlyX